MPILETLIYEIDFPTFFLALVVCFSIALLVGMAMALVFEFARKVYRRYRKSTK